MTEYLNFNGFNCSVVSLQLSEQTPANSCWENNYESIHICYDV